MIDEKQQPNLESLSVAWSERVKSIRQMAQKGVPGSAAAVATAPLPDHAPAAAADGELFSGPVYQDFSVQDVFVGDSDFYRTMQNDRSEVPVTVPRSSSLPSSDRKHSTLVPKVLAGCLIITTLTVLLYVVVLSGGAFLRPSARPDVRADVQQAVIEPPKEVVLTAAVEPLPEEIDQALSLNQPISLKSARAYYEEADYAQAYVVYKRLVQNLPEDADADPMRDFLRLNMALCLKKSGRDELSSGMLKSVAQGGSPVTRVLANYHLCLFERSQRQFLAMRSRAYQAIGLLDIMNFDAKWSQELRQNCYFLAGEAVTREALSLSDADRGLPGRLWPDFDRWDLPFADLDEESLAPVLNAGSMQLNKALLGPKIQEDRRDDASYWTVNCNKASIGELVSRFSANSGYDVRWGMDSNKASLRERPVSLYLTAVHDRQFMTVATGSVGLLALFDDRRSVMIENPAEYSSVSEQARLLGAEAVACWQTYLFSMPEGRYHANAYFATGLLKAQQGLFGESIAAYKMIPGSFSNSPLGPRALVSSAKLKIALHDYPGAYADLKEAIEQYPGHDDIEETYLTLANVAGQTRRDEEATKLYCKVYYLNSSRQSQSEAALSAGKILYQGGHYADAELWLSRYLDLVEDKNDENLHQGCLYLGKSWLALGNYPSACEALRAALSGKLSQKDYVETVTALVEGYMEQNRFGEAFGVLSEATARQLSQADTVHLLLLQSKALRGMGLTENAAALLTEREGYILDDSLKGKIGYALSDCYIELGQYDQAYKKLAAILEGSESGPEAHKIALKLAQVCLSLGLDDQALRVGSELLSLKPSMLVEQQALEVLAEVYRKQENYDRAALVLMGHWK
jgi:tetratricopeptide (TPR) repeat protein